MTRLNVAELTSGVGALVPQWFAAAARVIVLAGVIVHAFGMWDKHRLDGQAHAPREPWITLLYWICWLLLAGVLAFLAFGH